jgi:hypothetical protein
VLDNAPEHTPVIQIFTQATNCENKPAVKKFWKSFNVKYSADIIAKAWAKVSSQCCMKRIQKKCFLVLFMIFTASSWMKKQTATAMCCIG